MPANVAYLDCENRPGGKLERVKYFQRQLLSAEDMITDQEYFREKMRRHNRFLHGWGIVCGLEVKAAPTDEQPWRVQILPGYALGPQGDEIYVPEATYLDLAKCGPGASTDPCEPGRLRAGTAFTGDSLFVAIKYSECVSRPVRAMPVGCGCEEENCQFSRIRDSFEIGCLTELPPATEEQSLCAMHNKGEPIPCLPCPDEPWVILARIDLPGQGGIFENHIHYTLEGGGKVRRHIYSTAVLQQQLIKCCCNEPPGELFQVIETVPAGSTSSEPISGLFTVSENVEVIEVTFNRQANSETLIEGNFEVFKEVNGQYARPMLIAKISFDSIDSSNAEITMFPSLENGSYKVIVKKNVTDSVGVWLNSDNDSEKGADHEFFFKVHFFG